MMLDEGPSPEQIALWRGMSYEKRLRLAEASYHSTRELKATGIRVQHPDWPDERVNTEVQQMISRVDPEFFFESVLPMLTAHGERFDRQMMVEWLRQHGIESKSRAVSN